MNSYAAIGVAVVIGLMVLVRIIVVVCNCLSASEYEYVCPACGKRFFTRWYKLIPAHALWMCRHIITFECKPTARLKCPSCAKRRICYIPDRYPADFKPPSAWRGR